MLENVVNQVLTRLKALTRKSPEEGASSNLVSLNKVIIHETLVDILDGLENYID
jgi:hypothetical protein